MSERFQRYISGQPESPAKQPYKEPTLEEWLTQLVNRYSAEAPSGTPDFILARYLRGCLDLWNETIQARSEWRGERMNSIFGPSLDKTIPIKLYENEGGPPNQIGEAEVNIWPGETTKNGRIIGLKPVFEPLKFEEP